MAVEVGIAKYTRRSMGDPPGPWATITVRPTDDAQHPSLPFQEAGSLFEDREGDTWKIVSSTVVEDTAPRNRVGPESKVYSWRYTAELVPQEIRER